VPVSALELTLLEKQVRGSLFGSPNPRADIPRMLELHPSGKLRLEELRTNTYSLDHINAGYDDMRNGHNLHGVVSFS
jgi:Zn-dependent alcohol dehydrogenase